MTGPVLYLHGFASGPDSAKGRFFRDRFEARGVRVDLPDLTEGDFAVALPGPSNRSHCRLQLIRANRTSGEGVGDERDAF